MSKYPNIALIIQDGTEYSVVNVLEKYLEYMEEYALSVFHDAKKAKLHVLLSCYNSGKLFSNKEEAVEYGKSLKAENGIVFKKIKENKNGYLGCTN